MDSQQNDDLQMKIEQNIISRDWTILYKGRRVYINFTKSDGQILALCNRGNWEISEETDDGIEEFNAYVFKDGRTEEQRQAEENAKVIEELIAFCIENWGNNFMQELRNEMEIELTKLNR